MHVIDRLLLTYLVIKLNHHKICLWLCAISCSNLIKNCDKNINYRIWFKNANLNCSADVLLLNILKFMRIYGLV